MSKHHLRFRTKSVVNTILSALLTCSLLLPSIAVSAAESSAPETTPALNVWSGKAGYAFADGNGSRYDPYLINSAEELAFLAQSVNNGDDCSGQYFKLNTDLILNDLADFDNWGSLPPKNEWTPIGGYIPLSVNSESGYQSALEAHGTLYLHTEEGYTPADRYVSNAIYYHFASFNGHFDGNGHAIYGLYLSTDRSCAGLFGACEDAVLSDLTLGSALISGSEDVGGLIGSLSVSDSAQIENCRVEVNLTATGNRAGGLIGTINTTAEEATASVSNCEVTGKLNAPSEAGGLIGAAGYSDRAGGLQIENSTVRTSITAESAAGGIIGYLVLPATIHSCSSYGTVWADSHCGGTVGELHADTGYVTVSDCQNDSTVVGQDSVGGIIGLCQTESRSADESAPSTANGGDNTVVELLSCSNLGGIFGTQSAGGITGSVSTADGAKVNIIGCKNSASVSGLSKVGGIAGELSADSGYLTVGSNENHGTVTADTLAGGIAGDVHSASELTLYQCFSYADVTVDIDYAGGIAGMLTSTDNGSLLLELSCTNGSVKATKYAGGIVGSQSVASANARSVLTNCFSYAQITAEENAGGIAGSIEATSGQAVTSNSLFYGSFASGNKLTGGIAAYAHAVNSDAAVQINQCYFLQSAASRPALLFGGKGSELCQSANAMTDEALKNSDQLYGLDFTSIWQASDEENIYPTLQKLPFVWENFQYTVSGKSASVLAYRGRSDIVTVPAKLGGASVTNIADSAFSGQSFVKVVLPDSVATIGESAFANCENLRTITLSESLRAVGTGAFKHCTSLQTRRSATALTELYTGSDNQPFNDAELVLPITLQTDFVYEDGLTAAKSGSVTCYEGDCYLIDAPVITGYKADIRTLAGICSKSEVLRVIYRLGTYSLTVRYLYPDGSEAAPGYNATYYYGEQYSVNSPEVEGYLPANTVLEGLMEGEDMILTVYYSEALVNPVEERRTHQPLLIILLICSAIVMICCIGYFIFRYRSSHRAEAESADFHQLLRPRF